MTPLVPFQSISLCQASDIPNNVHAFHKFISISNDNENVQNYKFQMG